nr:immunoglobulin heavy chain junction region [Mus musculus]MBK4197539.1 immunoglobulin heavy chain junction region [Mus musculus]MBK4197540.1 immunoglobulin heavy chain junction region [Mus musculus]MBK4197541.1 immunoglobulin heavy chain junction region [Mus musculus]
CSRGRLRQGYFDVW